jgi:hypothetical protein
MEQANTPDKHLPHDSLSLSPEQIALKALVDELYRRSDTGVFAILNKYFGKEVQQNG